MRRWEAIPYSGARGSFLQSTLSRLADTHERLARTAARSFMISCDNAHAVHPAFREKHESNHRPLLNKGPVLKINASQRYATDSESAAIFKEICKGANLTCQQFVMRSDLACGSTIGPIHCLKNGHSNGGCGGCNPCHAFCPGTYRIKGSIYDVQAPLITTSPWMNLRFYP